MTAEQFIKDYTNHCSNELTDGGFHEWLTPEQALRAVELVRQNLWHDVQEVPEYKEDSTNLILVCGQTSLGLGCSVCNMIAEGVIYAPLMYKEYKWGECPFTKWAYVDELLPTDIKKGGEQ